MGLLPEIARSCQVASRGPADGRDESWTCQLHNEAKALSRIVKRFFLGGLIALLPTILTLWIFVALFGFVRDYIAIPVTRGIQWSLVTNQPGNRLLETLGGFDLYAPEHLDAAKVEEAGGAQALAEIKEGSAFFTDLSFLDMGRVYSSLDSVLPPVVGLLIGLVAIYFLGFLLRHWVGRYLFHQGERLLFNFPVVRRVYPYAKKIVEFLFSNKSVHEFKSVVAVPYPSPGLFSVGFVTSAGLASLDTATEEDYISVYLPSAPTPMTGYVIYVRREDILPLAVTLDQAMALIISGGAIVPESELCPVKPPQDEPKPVDVDKAKSLLGTGRNPHPTTTGS